MKKVDIRCTELERRCAYLDKELDRVTNDNIRLETLTKKTNLLMAGIPENDDKVQNGCLGALWWVLENKMGLKKDDVEIVHCYRVGAPPHGQTNTRPSYSKTNSTTTNSDDFEHLNG